MQLTRPLVVYDIETTDPEPSTCAIFEYAAVLMRPDGSRQSCSMRFKPWKPITPEAEEVTKVTNAMVENCPPFKDYAEKIWKSLQNKDLAGFNINRFDVIALDQELRRASGDRLKLNPAEFKVIDAYGIYAKKNPRDLTAAVKHYLGRDHEGAHGAMADAEATAEIILAQAHEYPDLREMSFSELADFSRMSEFAPVDLAGKLRRDEDGYLVFTFGKNEGKRVVENSGYCKWMSENNFPSSCMEVIEDELDRCDALRKAARSSK